MDAVITNNALLTELSFFREKLVKHNFIFSYRGQMSHVIVKNLLSLTEKKINLLNEDGTIKKKIFGVMINCLQTICTPKKLVQNSQESLFMIDKTETGYTIYTGIFIDSSISDPLIDTLNHINNLSNNLLSQFRKEKLQDLNILQDEYVIDNTTLALINIAKKSQKKINYDIEKLENEKSFFSLQIDIN